MSRLRAEDAHTLSSSSTSFESDDDDQIETLGKNKENVPLPRFAPAEYSSRRKKPRLSSRLVWDVTREDRRPARRSPPFGGFRPAFDESVACIISALRVRLNCEERLGCAKK